MALKIPPYIQGIGPHIAALFSLYFTDFRWAEFTAALAAAWTCGMQIGTAYMKLPPAKAIMVAQVVCAVGAVMYMRNPKKSDWKEPGSIKNDTQNGDA